MKKITAYIKPFRLESVIAALPREGVLELAIAEVRGYGRQKGQLELYQADEYRLTFLPKARLEIYCQDEAVEALTEALLAAARTGRIGDGKIMIVPIENVQSMG